MKSLPRITLLAGVLLLPAFLHAEDAPPENSPTDTSSQPSFGAQETTPEKDFPGNLLKNGNFSHGQTGWTCRGHVIDLPSGKKVLEVPLDDRDTQKLGQVFKVDRQTRVLKIRFSYKTSDDFKSDNKTSGQIRLLVWRASSYIYEDMGLKSSPEWHDINWTYDVPDGTRDLGFEIEIKPGAGKIQFADFVIEGLKG